MSDELAQVPDPAKLAREVDRLRAMITTLEERVRLLDHLAHHDSMIDLPNRRGFMRQLGMLIGRVSRYGDSAAMLFVDIDGLKLINDSLGHKAGDQALIQVADLLSQGVRTSDCVARLGGDEFGILLDHSDEQAALETAARLADQIAAATFTCDGVSMPLSVAIGVAVIGSDDTPAAVIARADEAMYREKAAA
ncbi:GGDEF domain-containing protein [Sphingomonas sp.]|uniref:GGDEF domain-containing protein n=1 Tax=Sphingomonas sp. TaxID=28214 RepID=UPI00286E0DD1|nr:GGDEF domain-containing protein [Sphingomonas sp.]